MSTGGLTPSTSGGASSPAAQRNLERAISDQQRRNAWPVLLLRVALTAVGSLLFVLLQTNDEHIAVSRVGTWAYFGIAVVLVAAVRAAPQLTSVALYAVALVDIPLLTVIQYLQLAFLPFP